MSDYTFEMAQHDLSLVSYKPDWTFAFEDCTISPVCNCQRWGGQCASSCDSLNWASIWRLRLSCPVTDVLDGSPRLAYGRWWEIPYKTKGDVIRTAFMACFAMEEHELREAFKYDGLAVFGPHIDLGMLVEMANRIEHQS